MPNRALTRLQTREVDARALSDHGLLGLVLMENAGRGCADWLEALGVTGRVAILCGKGNNAGDGFVIARWLEARGHPVETHLFSPPSELRGDAAANFDVLVRGETPTRTWPGDFTRQELAAALAGAAWIVDALLGTGAAGPPRPPLDRVLEVANAHPGRKFAVDVPSGLDCDTGEPAAPTFRADYTATFVATKPGFASPLARACLGEVRVFEIGAPRKLLRAMGLA